MFLKAGSFSHSINSNMSLTFTNLQNTSQANLQQLLNILQSNEDLNSCLVDVQTEVNVNSTSKLSSTCVNAIKIIWEVHVKHTPVHVLEINV